MYQCKVKTLYSVIDSTLRKVNLLEDNKIYLNEIKQILIWPIKKYCNREINKNCIKSCNKIIKIYEAEAEKLKYYAQSEIREQLTIIILSVDAIINNEYKWNERKKTLANIKIAAYYISNKLETYFKIPKQKITCK